MQIPNINTFNFVRRVLEDRRTPILHALLAAKVSLETLVAVRLWKRERKRLERHDVALMRNCYIFYHFMRKNVRIMLYFVAAVFTIRIYFFCGF